MGWRDAPIVGGNNGIAPNPIKVQAATLDNTGKGLNNTKTADQIRRERELFEFQRRSAAADAGLKERQLAEARAKPQPGQLTPDQLATARADAANKINVIRDIRRKMATGWLPDVGFGAETLAKIGGTDARDISSSIETLQASGALAEILKMSMQNGGKNPFTPMSNADVNLIARSQGNLDQGQSKDQFLKNLDVYERAYGNGFVGAGGAPKALRDRYRGDGPFPGKGGTKPKGGKGPSVSNW
jgi:hypothetical protein